jgi:hypothetical protein
MASSYPKIKLPLTVSLSPALPRRGRGAGTRYASFTLNDASSLSDFKNRSENSAERGQILTILQVNSHSIDQKSGETCTGQADLQPISFKSDRLLAQGI